MCEKNSSACPHVAITEQNERESPLLRFPGEIRNAIYGYVIDEGTYTFVHSKGQRWVGMAFKDPKPHRLALLSVCRQIHHEAAMLPFTLNTFRFDTLRTFGQCNKHLTRPQCHALKTLHLIVDAPEELQFLDKMKEQHTSLAEVYPGVQRVVVDLLVDLRFLPGRPPLYSRTQLGAIRYFKERLVESLRGNDAERKLEVVIREHEYT